MADDRDVIERHVEALRHIIESRCFAVPCRRERSPVHLIWGAADPIFEVAWARRWASQIPGATLDLVEGASHFVAEERGTEVAERILARLRRAA